MSDSRATLDIHCSVCRQYLYSFYWHSIWASQAWLQRREVPGDEVCRSCREKDQQ